MRPVSVWNSTLSERPVAAGVIAGMAGRVEVYGIKWQAGGPGGAFVEAGGGNGKIKQLEHGGALRAAVTLVRPAEVVCGQAALLIGRPGQRHIAGQVCDGIADGDGVAHGVDILRAGAQLVIDKDGAFFVGLQPCLFRQGGIRAYAGGQKHQIAGQ